MPITASAITSKRLRIYNRAIEIKPDYAEAYYNRGNAYNGLGNYKQAIEDLKQGDRDQSGLCRGLL